MTYYAGQSPLPERLFRLNELATDLWWSWHPDGREVFRRLDYPLWRATAHNPARMVRTIEREKLERAAADLEFLAVYDRALAALDEGRAEHQTWWSRRFSQLAGQTIAYFSAEFALHQSLPIYAGGLGVLAGDHCKEAADLGVPLIGVGFMYPQGYFHQHLTADGWQEESYERLNWADAPVEAALTPDGKPCITAVPLGDRSVLVAVWRVRIGRVTLYLLDTDLEENAPWDRELSARLYGGDRETRIQQEIVLGIGGVRALKALGLEPGIFHLNEGHAGFVVLQRIRTLIEQGAAFDEALDEIKRTTIFTTHTPVAAGHDAFPFQVVEKHLANCWGTLGSNRDRFLALGAHDNGGGIQFNMTALALRSAGSINGVSRLHGEVTRKMWASMWPDVPEHERPVSSVTNGVHVPSWIANDMASLFTAYLGEDWLARQDDPALWEGVQAIPDEALWAVRQSLRRYLFAFVRERSRQRWMEEHVGIPRVVAAGTLLEPDALTIGFARRFAGYKRPELVFFDPERLARILTAAGRPVQIIFAGKSHPADDIGKHHIQHVYRRALDPMFGGRIAFVDDYDLHVAHFLVQGCDAWLNNPRKPLEASGTSGMKAAINGVPHVSIGDGWWAEGAASGNGWVIDGGAPPENPDAVDAADANALYRLLEEEIAPAFYDRDAAGVPHRWLATVKNSISTVAPRFSARRMVKEYAERMYAPALEGRAAIRRI
ncbi:MAG: alpha-glucan phosphorylase [Acidobacteria bacterium RIFCSPLOWO2_12_FULL_66_10]|nr:MAG: alpha-glucan phosphorylase [Acidobacteria bacterium RIFCSPLOWO2_12_FULL_66_10]